MGVRRTLEIGQQAPARKLPSSWEKDHDEGEDHRWYQSEQSQGPWELAVLSPDMVGELGAAGSSGSGPTRNSGRLAPVPLETVGRLELEPVPLETVGQLEPEPLERGAGRRRAYGGFGRRRRRPKPSDPVVLRERQRAFDETSSDRSRTPRKLLPSVPEVPPEGLPIVGAEAKTAAKTKPSKEGQTYGSQEQALEGG